MTPERWGRLREIFGNALEIPAAERPRFLDAACGSDSAMRAELENLLAGGEEPSWQSPVAALQLTPGDTVAHFRIESTLGRGGMGIVYRAYDTRLQRPVALKVLPPEHMADPARKQRLIREARAASALNHPNIVTVYDIGSEGAVDFISMEYVEGRPLSQAIRARELPLARALDYAIEIADGLARAHAAGVIHRDLKPANIMLTADGRIKILDFGLARQVRPAEAETATLSAAGEIAGTPHYMSSEQARGLKVDARTDIFSLGVVLYEMLAGRRPFDGDSASHAMMCILEKDPLPLAGFLPDAPEELQRIVSKMLEKDREQRYQSAKDLEIDLKRLRQKLDSRPQESRRGWKVAVAIALLAGAAAAAGTFLYLRRASALTNQDTILLADFDNTTGDSVFDNTLKRGLATQLEQSPFLSLLSEEQIRETLGYMGRQPEERITHAIGREICQRRGAKALIEGSIAPLGSHYVLTLQAVNAVSSDSIGRVQVEADAKERVLRALGEASTQLRRKLGESLASIAKYDAPLIQATTSSLEALQAYSMAEQRSQLNDGPGALRYRKRAVELDPNFALAYKSLSMSYLSAGERGEPAMEAARKAFDLRDRTTELERLMIEAHYYRFVTRDLDRAIERLETATQAYPRSAVAWNNLGGAYTDAGLYEKSLPAFREAARMPTALSLNILVFNLSQLDRFAEMKGVCLAAAAQKLEFYFCRLYSYRMAVLERNDSEVKRQLEWVGGSSAFNQFTWRRTAAAFQGQLRLAHEFAERGIAINARRQANSPIILTDLALDYAVAGQCPQANEFVRATLGLRHTRDILVGVALAAALCRDAGRTVAIAGELAQFGPGTGVKPEYAPCLLDMVQAPAESAIPSNAGSMPLFHLAYCRGRVLLAQRKGAEAEAQFRIITDHRDWDPLNILHPAAYVGLARAAAIAGDLAKSRKAYQDFFALWKDADPDLPILLEARREYEKVRKQD